MERIEYHGWQGCVRLANSAVEVVVSTQFGPRIMRFGRIAGPNMLGEDESLWGKVGPADEWVNYGGHRLWHAPEVMPRTYEPDNAPVEEVLGGSDDAIVVKQSIEPHTGIGKSLVIRLGRGDAPVVEIDHVLTNHNAWPIEAASWALSVVAPGGRVILPQEPFLAHGEGDNYAPSRPLVLWPFTDMADPRFTWGRNYVQLRSDADSADPQKIGVFNSLGWTAFHAPSGELFVTMIDAEGLTSGDMADMGCNFETFTKAQFQELESLGPLALIDPGDQVIHTVRWVLLDAPGLPADDEGLAETLPALLETAQQHLSRFDSGG